MCLSKEAFWEKYQVSYFQFISLIPLVMLQYSYPVVQWIYPVDFCKSIFAIIFIKLGNNDD